MSQEAIRSVVLAQGCVQVETARTPKAVWLLIGCSVLPMEGVYHK